ncbi:exostosin domain-containing protein [Cyanobium gracile]|uniref:Exostosin family protein n=1 Tax=Cyanobium gracile UHCC 0281 TaxID=3110309 RepID=A0ABU5SXN6_9CYAN|nr:exostosin family protein [Cyanobium gracile]MEA5443272.1 exostosin family protein [Cyanobium gracile UHCC 0281]
MNQLTWQRPNKTEEYAWEAIDRLQLSCKSIRFFRYPWASWIDKTRDSYTIGIPKDGQTFNGITATVCQHIDALKHIYQFKECGITDLFWSHATHCSNYCEGVRIHPFPLYPVRCSDYVNADHIKASDRLLLYSFQGAYQPDLYICSVRAWIAKLPDQENAIVRQTDEWHFEQVVYREQVHDQLPDPIRHQQLKRNADFYVELMRKSVFALCPSGSGPNSIRLWEALGFGAIPVILSDRLRLPGDPSLWKQAAVFVPEEEEAVMKLPELLGSLSSSRDLLNSMQKAGALLYRRYGIPLFCSDLVRFHEDPDGFLLSQSIKRLSGNCVLNSNESPADPIIISSSDSSTLPKNLMKVLRGAQSDLSLIIQVISNDPLPLINARWRSSIKLCKTLIGESGIQNWAVSSRSPDIELLTR